MNLIARTIGTRTGRLGLTLALSFAVAACASQSDAPKPPATQRTQPAATTSEPSASEPSASESRQDSTPSESRMTSRGSGERVEIRRSWVQVRSQPNENAKAIALVFGNDQLEVEGEEGDWVRVRLSQNRSGWIPMAATERP